MSAITILCEESIKAFNNIAKQRNANYGDNKDDYARASELLKKHLKANLDNVMAEWREALEARISEGWLSVMIKTQANEIALRAIEEF